MARLDQRGLLGILGNLNPGRGGDQIFNGNRIHAFITALINDFQMIFRQDAGQRQLQSAGAPAAGNRHFPGSKRNLISRNRDSLQGSPANLTLAAFVKKGKVDMLVHAFSSLTFRALFSLAWNVT